MMRLLSPLSLQSLLHPGQVEEMVPSSKWKASLKKKSPLLSSAKAAPKISRLKSKRFSTETNKQKATHWYGGLKLSFVLFCILARLIHVWSWSSVLKISTMYICTIHRRTTISKSLSAFFYLLGPSRDSIVLSILHIVRHHSFLVAIIL